MVMGDVHSSQQTPGTYSPDEVKEFRRTVLVDFDGVIHRMPIDNYRFVAGDPIPGAHQALKTLVIVGYKVVILTARPPHDHAKMRQWCEQHFGKELTDQLEITNVKRPSKFIIDDRAIRFTSWDDMLNYLR